MPEKPPVVHLTIESAQIAGMAARVKLLEAQSTAIMAASVISTLFAFAFGSLGIIWFVKDVL